ncbi:MAG TPA: insulinase family protein [Candidatus Coprenecus pullistercoris]|nr:insulinase family protein [Candidatus Coprenecus pullistercoris]
MKFAFKRSSSPVAYCALHIKAGTRYESAGQGGLAHFTEHLLFKGTETRNAGTVNSYIEKLGGELNAYTAKEETVIHATVLKEDLRKAINLLMDIAFRCTFPEKEIDKERGVVLEEISSYKDSPAEQIYDDFEEIMFKDSPLSMPVLGKARYLRKAGRDTVMEYYSRMFRPENMYFTAVADTDGAKVREMVLKALATYSTSPYVLDCGPETGNPQETDAAPAVNPPFEISTNRHSHQTHCVIGARAYSAYDPMRIPLSLLINIIGGPVANSRLNLLLRERYGLVYSVDASYTPFTDAGIAAIYFGCDKSNTGRCLSLISKLLSSLRQKPLSRGALDAAKKQLLGQLAIASDNGEAQVLSMGKSLMTYGRVIDNDETAGMISSVTAEDIQRAAAEVFDENALSRIMYI